MADSETVIEIKLKPHLVLIRDYYHRSISDKKYIPAIPADAKLGKAAANQHDVVKHLAAGKGITLIIPEDTHMEQPQDSFWKGFLGPSARKLGVNRVRSLVATDENRHGTVRWAIQNYLNAEQERIEARARKKAKKEAMESPDAWTDPVKFFVPEIGTLLKLTHDWRFHLHQERRNSGMIELLDVFGGKSWGHRSDPGGIKTSLITIMAGSELTVDRIYIRKGGEDYSSLTFWLGKNAVIVDANGKQFTPTSQIRFWAKLWDVNRIQGLVNKASVPGLE